MSKENLKALFSKPDKRLMRFIMNVAANTTTGFGAFKKTIKKLANKKISVDYKRKLVKKKGHLFFRRLVVRNTSAYKQL